MKTVFMDELRKVREKRPLVLQITNDVTINDCANMTICTGGSPVMSDSAEDASSLAKISSAVVLNIGTVNEHSLEVMLSAGRSANMHDVPVLLDPVGAGATDYRSDIVEKILSEIDIAVIKGNAGEISSLAGNKGTVKGVDSISDPDAGIAVALAKRTGAIVAMTGPTDYVSDGMKTYRLSNGTHMMECVSGTGCILSSIVGCFIGANGVDLKTVAAALSLYSSAGEIATEESKGPGTFKMSLFDTMYNLESLEYRIRTRAEII